MDLDQPPIPPDLEVPEVLLDPIPPPPVGPSRLRRWRCNHPLASLAIRRVLAGILVLFELEPAAVERYRVEVSPDRAQG